MKSKSGQDGLAHAIFLNALDSSHNAEFINTSDLTEAILETRKNPKIWLNTRGRIRWTADIWLKVMLATKQAELSIDSSGRMFMHATLEIPEPFAERARRISIAHIFTKNRPSRWWAPESERLTGESSSEILESKQIDEKIAGDSGA